MDVPLFFCLESMLITERCFISSHTVFTTTAEDSRTKGRTKRIAAYLHIKTLTLFYLVGNSPHLSTGQDAVCISYVCGHDNTRIAHSKQAISWHSGKKVEGRGLYRRRSQKNNRPRHESGPETTRHNKTAPRRRSVYGTAAISAQEQSSLATALYKCYDGHKFPFLVVGYTVQYMAFRWQCQHILHRNRKTHTISLPECFHSLLR